MLHTDQGSLLYDVGFGLSRPTLAHNAIKLGVSLDQVDAIAISHLHFDHMGGMKASRSKQVMVPNELGAPRGKPCCLPDEAGAKGSTADLVKGPRLLTAGIASIGPLARIKDKGLVIFTGCGHPTIEVILQMVRRLSDQPIHAIGSGLHFPITSGRGKYRGIHMQMILDTGKPPWQRITDDDLSKTIGSINAAGPEHIFFSAHDTCDYALRRFANELKAEATVLRAGATYRISV